MTTQLEAAWFKEGRQTLQKMQVNYKQVSERNWYVLDVLGVPFDDDDKKKQLKALGFWWDRKKKLWTINSGTEYSAFGQTMSDDLTDDGQPNPKLVEKNRKNALRRKQQEKAFPLVQQMAKEYNDQVAIPHNKALKKLKGGFPTDPAEVIKYVNSLDRREKWVSNAGISIKAIRPQNRYEFFESYVAVTGNTYPIKDILKNFGFRWKSPDWVLPYVEWSVVEKDFFRAAGQVIQSLQGGQPAGPQKGLSERDLALVLMKTKKQQPRAWDALMGWHYQEETGLNELGWIKTLAKWIKKMQPNDQTKWVDLLSKGDYRGIDKAMNHTNRWASSALTRAWFN
jgi:hypothetical protein